MTRNDSGSIDRGEELLSEMEDTKSVLSGSDPTASRALQISFKYKNWYYKWAKDVPFYLDSEILITTKDINEPGRTTKRLKHIDFGIIR